LIVVQYVPSGQTRFPQILLFRLSSISFKYFLDGPQTPWQLGPGTPQSERQYSSQTKSMSLQRLQSEERRQRPHRSSVCCAMRSCSDCGGGWRGRCWTWGRCCWVDGAPRAAYMNQSVGFNGHRWLGMVIVVVRPHSHFHLSSFSPVRQLLQQAPI
jgi:hypothetical protein